MPSDDTAEGHAMLIAAAVFACILLAGSLAL